MMKVADPNCSRCWGQTYLPGFYEACGFDLVCPHCFPEAKGCPYIHRAQGISKARGIDSWSAEWGLGPANIHLLRLSSWMEWFLKKLDRP